MSSATSLSRNMDKAVYQSLRCLQRRRGIGYVAVGSVIGFFVGYFALPRLHWLYGIIGSLSFTMSLQLSLMRQHRRTWQSRRLLRFVDSIERIAAGISLAMLNIYVLIGGVPIIDFVAIGSWCVLFVLAGTAAGEYWWQQRCFVTLDRSSQLRYLCAAMRHWNNH